MTRRLLYSLFALAAGAPPVAAQSAAPPTLIRDVAVFDGERALGRRSVLIADSTIASIDHKGAPPPGARIVDGAGHTLIPGFIDAHVHAFAAQDTPLLFGVTTQIDMFTPPEVTREVRARMAAGTNSAAADIVTAGVLATAPGGHGTQFGMSPPTLTTPAQADAWVAARIAEGSDFIKIVDEPGTTVGRTLPTLNAPTIRALIDAAHKRGKLAVVHALSLAGATSAIEAGADGLVHLFTDADGGDAFARRARAAGAFIIPTGAVIEGFAGRAGGAPLADRPALAGLLPPPALATLRQAVGGDRSAAFDARQRVNLSALARAGVPILAGTDAGNPGTYYGISMHRELQLLVAAGLTPAQALTAATAAPAKAFRLKDRGRIAPGLSADLILVVGDPTADIEAVHAIAEVWKDGVSANPLRLARRAEIARAATAGPPVFALPADGRIARFTAEGGNAVITAPVGLGWQISTDAIAGGKSTVALAMGEPAPGGQPTLVLTGDIRPDFMAPWAGIAFNPGAQPFSAVSLAPATALKFRARGQGGGFAAMGFSVAGGQAPSVAPFTIGAEWREVTVPFASLTGFDPKGATLLLIAAAQAPGPFRLELADVQLVAE